MLYSPVPMHIPDGFLSTLVAVILWILSAGGVAYALRRVGKDVGERQVPLMGVLAAAIFAGQMLNFSVTGGTSGHLLGAALATILLGPWAAVIVMTTVVSIQALIFQDGGLLALGGNLFNMALIGVAVSYFVYTSLQKIARGQKWGIFAGGALAAWLSIVVAALACALELALSGTSPANLAVPAMGAFTCSSAWARRPSLSARWPFSTQRGATCCTSARPRPKAAQRSGPAAWSSLSCWRFSPRWPRPIPTGWSGWLSRRAS